MRDLVLMGLRGSGKSTIGRRVSERLGFEFVDLDERVLGAMGCATVREAWERFGESAFRAGEGRALAVLLGEDRDRSRGRVIALGGGTPMVPEAAAALQRARERGFVWIVYLHAPPEVLANRIDAGDPNRPRLGGAAGVEDEMRSVYQRRDGVYRSLADAVVDASRSEDEVVPAVLGVAGGAEGGAEGERPR
ncbi:MAG: shikimate kinase [Phycisphaerales bacterium]